MAAGRAGMRWFQWGARRAFQLIERVTGLGFLEDVSEFLLAFEHMSEGFRARAREVRALMSGPDAAFVLVSSAETESVKQAALFLERLEANAVNVAGLVANRVRTWPDAGPVWSGEISETDEAALAEALARVTDDGFPASRAATAAVAATARYAALVRRDARALASLRDQAERRGSFFRVVPELAGDVHDLDGVSHVAHALRDDENAAVAPTEIESAEVRHGTTSA
jgi:anion-transporting  ArsA/GET3 family ATPase